MSRIVDIRVLGGDLDAVRRRTDNKIEAALGYLVSWALPGEEPAPGDHVSITITSTDCEAAAYYSKTKEDRNGMLMVAVWREAEGKYTFHT